MQKDSNQIKQAIARLLGAKPAQNHPAILVSFPKSGRPWLRVMLDAARLNIDYTHDFSGHRGQRSFSEMELLNQAALVEEKPAR